MDTQIAKREAYDETYGLFDYESDEWTPLSIVAALQRDDPTDGIGVTPIMERFARNRVHQLVGISLDRFLEMPRHRCEEIFRICTVMQQKQTNSLADLENEMQQNGGL